MSEKVVSLREKKIQKGLIQEKIRYKGMYDYFLIVVQFVLLCFGLVMIYSASYYAADARSYGLEHYFSKQLICIAIGGLCMAGLMFFDYHKYIGLPRKGKKGTVPLYWVLLGISVITLLLVFTPLGQKINGSRRWINVGISIQPVEIVKFALIIFFACVIGKDPLRVKCFWRGIVMYLALVGIIGIPIILQPNLSALILLCVLSMIVFYIGGAKMKHLLIVAGVAVLAIVILAFSESYRADRVSSFSDPLGEWQTEQSLYSFGAGGLFGRGLGNSMQKMLYLPMSESDFIFAIVAEELGLVGAAFVLALYGLYIWRGVIIAINAPDLTGTIMAGGIVTIMVLQVVINIGVTLCVIPTTGVLLPFLSAGGSGVIIFMAMTGVLLNISKQTRHSLPPVPKAAKPRPGAKQPGRKPMPPTPKKAGPAVHHR